MSCSKTNFDKPNPLFKLEKPDTIVPSLSYSVYLSYLKNLDFSEKVIVIEQLTNSEIYCNFNLLRNKFPDIDSVLLLDFELNNKSNYALDSAEFNRQKNVILISSNERNYLIDNPDFNYSWDEFYKKYPNAPGLFSFSMVGFNGDSNQIILGCSYAQPNYRRDECYYMIFENNNWIIKWKEGIHTQN